ncbi:MAG: TIR domain-containing protein [Rhodospirillales bacterium]|nr:TIR domain-containing protein [Rhodospirillales bacterium]
MTNKGVTKRDVFLCHCSKDKDEYIIPLSKAFENAGITFWIDNAMIRWGDSISKAVNEGLETSSFVIVFISEEFINQPWPEAELYASLSRENSSGEVIVLPLLIANPKSVLTKYPLLHDKLYLKWEDGIEEIVQQLLSRLGRNVEKTQILDVSAEDNPSRVELMVGYGGMIQLLNRTPRPQEMAGTILNNICHQLVDQIAGSQKNLHPNDSLEFLQTFLQNEKKSQDQNTMVTTKGPNGFDNLLQGNLETIVCDATEIERQCNTKKLLTTQEKDDLYYDLLTFYALCFNVVTNCEAPEDREISEALASGETQYVEFKETLRWDVRLVSANKELVKAVARTIAGLMNSDGGLLLIGVDDHGNTIGLERDFKSLKMY